MTLKRDKWIELIEGSFVALYLRLTKLSEVSTSNMQMNDGAPRLYLIHHSYPIEEGGDCKKQGIQGAKELPIRHQRILFSFIWQSMPVILTLEMFDEYFTLSTAIDLSRCPASNAKLRKAIKIFNNLASKRDKEIGKSKDAVAHAPQESKFKCAFEFIYYTAWKSLYDDIFPAPLSEHAATLGKVFAEFRGFIACRAESQFIAIDGKVNQPLEKEIGNKHFNREDAIRCVDTIRPFMAADTLLHRDQKDKRGAEYLEPREFTFTTVLDGRYIYASALGTPPSHLRGRDMPLTYMLLSANHSPSELGLLVDGFHVLGTTRLAALYDFPHVTHAALELRDLEGDISALLRGMIEGKPDEDMAAAGERLTQELPAFSARLVKVEQDIKSEDENKRPQAALDLREMERDISKLRLSMKQRKADDDDDAAAAVKRLARKLRNFSARLAKIEQGIRSEGEDNRTRGALDLHELGRDIGKLRRSLLEGKKAAVKRLARKLRDFSERLAEIELGISSDHNDKRPQIVGGLPFRVERSHYYQRQFRDLVKGLRIGRIEGFQTYDEAVSRRLGGIYELIDTVGLRHGRLREILAGLSRQVQSARQLELTTAITNETRTIEKLQEGAETAFFAFLFPYYFSHVVTDLAAKAQFAEMFPLIEHLVGIDRTILFYSIAIGAIRAIYPWLTRKFRVAPAATKRFKWGLGAFVAVAPLLLSFVVTQAVHTPPFASD